MAPATSRVKGLCGTLIGSRQRYIAPSRLLLMQRWAVQSRRLVKSITQVAILCWNHSSPDDKDCDSTTPQVHSRIAACRMPSPWTCRYRQCHIDLCYCGPKIKERHRKRDEAHSTPPDRPFKPVKVLASVYLVSCTAARLGPLCCAGRQHKVHSHEERASFPSKAHAADICCLKCCKLLAGERR